MKELRQNCSWLRREKLKKFWVTFQTDPVFMRKVNGWFTVGWIVMIPMSFWTGWIHSVAFVSVLSLWALVSGHWSVWQAARVEVRQEKELKKDVEGSIVQRLILETTLEKAED